MIFVAGGVGLVLGYIVSRMFFKPYICTSNGFKMFIANLEKNVEFRSSENKQITYDEIHKML